MFCAMKLKSMALEVTNRCNLGCAICWGRRQTRGTGFMSESLFRSALEQGLSSGVQIASLHFNGESTLHPRFAAMILAASGRGVALNYSTNGVDVPDEVIEATMRSDVRKVNFSVHVNDDRPLATAMRYRRARDKLGRRRPRLTSTLNYEHQPQWLIDELRRKWYGAVDTFGVTGTIRDMKWSELPPTGVVTQARVRCTQPLRYVAVLWDGRIAVCCRDLAGELASGVSLEKASLDEILASKHYVSLRAQIIASGYPSGHALCRRCSLWKTSHRFAVLDRP